MLRIFRTDIFLQSIIILIVAGVMWFGAFADPQPLTMIGGGQLYYWLMGLLSPLVGTIIGLIFVLVEGFLLNSMLYRYKLISQSTLMPMLFYVIAMSVCTPTLTPIVLGSLLLLLAVDQLMLDSTLLSLPLDKIFGAAACIGLATLFCPAMAVFFIPMVVTMINYSLYGWRDWTMLVLGALAPYILLETYFYLDDQLFYRNYLILYSITDLHLRFGGSWVEWVGSAIFLVTLLAGLGAASVNSQTRTINFKKNITTILLFILGSICYAIYTTIIPVPAQAYAIPFACCATSLFIEPKRKEFGSNLIFLLLISIFIAWSII